MSNSIPSTLLEKFTTFGDLLRFLRRHAGITQLELSVAVGYSDAQISRLEQNLRLPDIPTIEARFVQALDLEDEPRAVARLLDLAANVRREDAPALGLSPYRGLSCFEETDAELFVGREGLTARLTERVLSLVSAPSAIKERFLAVVGASGSGKSSLVRAGLVPSLRWNKASADWLIHTLTPTSHPLESLALSLTPQDRSIRSTASLMDDLVRDPRSLHLYARRWMGTGNNSHLLLVVDQFEELFSLCRSEDERTSFVDNLLAAVSEPDGPVMVVITLRADFYSHCAGYPHLREALARGQEYIGAMTSSELRRAIEEPASRGRWELEPGLVDLLLHDVGHEPGALPLLSHALLETWQRRRGRLLTLSGYSASGGVRGAIAETAEAVFTDKFTRAQQVIARRVFLRLTELGDETAGGDTRRRASLDELVLKPDEAGTTQVVLKLLADARLITTSESSVEVAHEALIREWPTLRGWLEDNREGLRLHRQLTEAAQEWAALDYEPDLLFRGARLTQAQEWGTTHGEEMNTLEHEFLAASIQAREHEAIAWEEQRQRELEAAHKLAEAERGRAELESQRAEEQLRNSRQLSKRARYLAGALIIALLMAFIALYFGSQARRTAVTAQTERRIATGRELAAASLNNLSIDPERSILLALQSVSTTRRVDGTVLPESLEALHQSLVASPVRMTIKGQGSRVLSSAFSPDGKQLAAISDNGTIVIWDPATGAELRRMPGTTQPGDLVSAQRIAYSPDGKLLAGCDKDEVKIYDSSTGALVRTISGPLSQVLALAFSRDGKLIATGALDGSVQIWEAASGSLLHTLAGHASWIESLSFSPDGKWLLSGGNDFALKIWNVLTGELVQDYPDFDAVIDSIVFSPDGKRIAFTHGILRVWQLEFSSVEGRTKVEHQEILKIDGAVYVRFSPDGKFLAGASSPTQGSIWDAATGKQLMTLVGHTDWVMGPAISPDGTQLATTSLDGTIRIWSIAPGREVVTVPALPTIYGTHVAYSPDGREIAINQGDGSAALWDAATGRPGLILAGHDGVTMSVAFSSDGKRIATGGLDGKAIVWDAASGRKLLTLSGHTDGVRDVTFSRDGGLIATASFDNTARVWDAASGKELLKIAHERIVLGIAFSPDGTRFATSSTDGAAQVWDTKTGKLLFRLSGHAAPVTEIVFSPDGSRIATASPDKTARIWDAATGTELLTLAGNASGIRTVAFSPDGSLVATGSDDSTAKVWDAATGAEMFAVPGGLWGVGGVAFSPQDGGAHLAVASNDGVVRVFVLPIDDLLALAQSRVTRSLTLDECRKYLHMEQCPAAPAPE